MRKACSRCGKIHDYTYECNYGRERRFASTPESKLRSKSSWQKKRASIKELSFNLCEVCKAQGVFTYDGIEVHHIRKLKEDPNGLLDDHNLVALCTYHHKLADRGELTQDYLYSLVEQREKEQGDSITDYPAT